MEAPAAGRGSALWVSASCISLRASEFAGASGQDSQPEDDDGRENGGRWEYLEAPVIVGHHAPPALEPAKHDLDAVPSPVAALVVFDRGVSLLPAADSGAYPLVLQSFTDQSAS